MLPQASWSEGRPTSRFKPLKRPRLVATCTASLSPVVKYHGLGRRYLTPLRFLDAAVA
jgi:hypothetical protein